MKKVISLLCLSLLCSFPVFSKMSDDEARAFLESLAESSPEKKVFYRWQSETSKKNLLQTGEMTPKLHNYFMNSTNDLAGAGFYVAEEIFSSTGFGGTIIKVEVEPSYKYLDLLDEQIQEKLQEANLTKEDVYRLNPKVAVKYTDTFLVLKAQEGVKFKVFPKNQKEEKQLLKMMDTHLKKRITHIHDFIRFLKVFRLTKTISDKSKDQLEIDIRKKLISFIKTPEDGVKAFSLLEGVLNVSHKIEIMKKSISLIEKPYQARPLLYELSVDASSWGQKLHSELRQEISRKVQELEVLEFEAKKQAELKRKADIRKRRLSCIKNQLSKLLGSL